MADAAPDVILGRSIEVHESSAMGSNLCSIGDVNGDGFADLAWSRRSIVSVKPVGVAFLYLGAPTGEFDNVPDSELATGRENDGFGFDIGTLGDVNNDGFDDVFVLSARDGDGFASGDVYLGNAGLKIDSRSDLTLLLSGYRLAAAGDVNGDGASDLAAGEPFNETGGPSAGAVHLYLGTPGSAPDSMEDALLIGRGNQDQFGSGVASAGDVNGDGFGDVMVGNSRNDDNGQGQSGSVELFFGGLGEFDVTSDATLRGLVGNDSFGEEGLSAGDVNGDGFGDVLVGAPGTQVLIDSFIGRVYLYLGGLGSFDTSVDAMITGRAAGARLGTSVSFTGDVNGDGFGDFAIGAPSDDLDRGRTDIYFGVPGTAPDTSTDGVLLGEAMSNSFGFQIAETSPPTSQLRRSFSASSSAASLMAKASPARARGAAPTCRAAAGAAGCAATPSRARARWHAGRSKRSRRTG